MKRYQIFSPLLISVGLLTGFNSTDKPNELTAQEKKQGWSLLFDGKSTNGWHLYNKGKVPSAWIVREGELHCDPTLTNAEHGDLVTDKEYENYDLKFDWKISKAGNGGVFVNVKESKAIPTAWASGPE